MKIYYQQISVLIVFYLTFNGTLYGQWSRAFDLQTGNESASDIIPLDDGVIMNRLVLI